MRGLTFELSWHQRWDARARLAKMYSVPPTGPAWPAVGAQLERGVRQQLGQAASGKRLAKAVQKEKRACAASRAWPVHDCR